MVKSISSRIRLVSLFLLMTAAAAAGADLPIASIRVTGLRRTRDRTVHRLLERFLGRPASSLDESEVSAVLIGTGIFENVRAAAVPAEDGATSRLEVSVDEKWSLLALPIFAASADGITAGAAFIDANAFGRNDKLVSAAVFLPAGMVVSAAYLNQDGRKTSRRHGFSAYISRMEKEDLDESERPLRRYGSTASEIGFEISQPVFGELYASAGFAFRERSAADPDRPALALPESAQTLSGRAGVSARQSQWNGTFLSETFLNAGWSYAFALAGNSFYTLDARAGTEKPLGSAFRVRARTAAVYAPDAPPVFNVAPSALAINILPSYFAARSAAAAEIGLETKLAKLRFGLISALASYELAVAEGDLIGDVFAHGPSGGIRLYVAKIAVPAMSLVVSYNAETGLFQGSFGVGMRM